MVVVLGLRMVVGARSYLVPATWYLVWGGTRMPYKIAFPRTTPGAWYLLRRYEAIQLDDQASRTRDSFEYGQSS